MDGKDECDERKDICCADDSFRFDATWRIGIFGLCSLGFGRDYWKVEVIKIWDISYGWTIFVLHPISLG